MFLKLQAFLKSLREPRKPPSAGLNNAKLSLYRRPYYLLRYINRNLSHVLTARKKRSFESCVRKGLLNEGGHWGLLRTGKPLKLSLKTEEPP